MNILCLDYGTKRIGIALSTSPIAQPIGIIPNSNNPSVKDIITSHALDQIVKLLDEFHIEKILVGISEGEMAEKTRSFIDQLRSYTQLPIEEIDETLSSVNAGEQMHHMKKKKRRGNRDHLAAATMLQEYLDVHE